MFIDNLNVNLEVTLQNTVTPNSSRRDANLLAIPNVKNAFTMQPENNDRLIISLRYLDSDYKLGVAPYIDGINTMDENGLIPSDELISDYNAHTEMLVGNTGSALYIQNWKTIDDSNPFIVFTTNDNKMVKNYVNNVSKSEENTIRLVLFTSKIKTANYRQNISDYITKGGADYGTRGRSLGGVGLGDNSGTNYVEADFKNPKFLGTITIFYKVSDNKLPKFSESFFQKEPFGGMPRV